MRAFLLTTALTALTAPTSLAAASSAAGACAMAVPEDGERGLAIRCAKVLTCALERPVVDNAVVLIRDGRIEAVGAAAELDVPSGYRVLDVGKHWVMPGMVDLHSHIAGTFDINDMVYQSNTGLRVSTAVIPDNPALRRAVAGGVTTILFIPGSGTNFGGQGILLKTSPSTFEAMRIREPGSLKLAQADNPKRWGWGMNRITLNWQVRNTIQRGVAYAYRWEAFERGEGRRPDIDPMFEVFRDLVAKRTQISAHTQVYQVVCATIRIAREEFGLDVYIDHGSFDGFLAAELAEKLDVPAILGPRSISAYNAGRGIDHDGRIIGFAGEYQARGHSRIGFNTDAPVIAQEQLALQAGMGVRYGFDDTAMDTVRGLTIVPAETAGIADRVGSLEAGKHADLLVVQGHPADPRNSVERVYVEGRLVYDAEVERRF